jgi:hypothetical protein
MWTRTLTWLAVLLVVVAAAPPVICYGQEIMPPANAGAVEQLPPAPNAQPISSAMPDQCQPVPVDPPLSAITTDIRPRASDGKLVAPEQLPFNCSGVKPVQQQMMSIGLQSDTCYPGYCDLLSMARFYHKPLYFNDDCLERCGVKRCCCQPSASAMCFYGRALLLPVTACCVCPCSCVPSGGCCP